MTFHRVRYDIDRTQRLMREAGLPGAPRGAPALRPLTIGARRLHAAQRAP